MLFPLSSRGGIILRIPVSLKGRDSALDFLLLLREGNVTLAFFSFSQGGNAKEPPF